MKFENIEDAEKFVETSFNYLLWAMVIGLSIIFLPLLWPLITEGITPEWWATLETLLGITW